MKKVAIIGTVGIPANYGGFETLAENIVDHNRSEEIQYMVYCCKKNYKNKLWVYKGAKLVYLPLDANGFQSILYDVFSILDAARKADVLLILGVSGCIILPFLRIFCKKRVIVNIDGLEHRRAKWGRCARLFLKISEKMAVKYGDVIITDNKGIQDYVKTMYKSPSELIAYGGDQVCCNISSQQQKDILKEYNIYDEDFSFGVCRIEPENNVHIILEAFKNTGKRLLFVGNWNISEYGKSLFQKYKDIPNISLLPPIYDLKILNVFRSYCLFYIHGHSAGGTNPSLVEAMFFGKPILAFNVIYNIETTEGKAKYFSDVLSLEELLVKSYDFFESCKKAMVEIAFKKYRWEIIAKEYERLY